MREEITTQIGREVLAGLLDASAGTAKRVTARMPAVEAAIEAVEPVPPELSGDFVIRFNVKPAAKKPILQLPRSFVIGASFVLSLIAGIGLAAAIM